MKTVTLNMTDLLTDKIVERIIDVTNAMKSGAEYWVLGTEASQRERLEMWISDRANEQHETYLCLNSWVINN